MGDTKLGCTLLLGLIKYSTEVTVPEVVQDRPQTTTSPSPGTTNRVFALWTSGVLTGVGRERTLERDLECKVESTLPLVCILRSPTFKERIPVGGVGGKIKGHFVFKIEESR